MEGINTVRRKTAIINESNGKHKRFIESLKEKCVKKECKGMKNHNIHRWGCKGCKLVSESIRVLGYNVFDMLDYNDMVHIE